MHFPGRPVLAVVVVGECGEENTAQLLAAWQRRAREVQANCCVIEIGEAAEDAIECADVLKQHVPASAMVVLVQSDGNVSPDQIERAQDALSLASLARQSRGPYRADHEHTFRMPLFPPEEALQLIALYEGSEQASVEAVNRQVEDAFKARDLTIASLRLQQKIDAIEAALERNAAEIEAVRQAAGVLARTGCPDPGQVVAPSHAFLQQVNRLQFKPHWQARASTPQAARVLSLLLRVEGAAGDDPESLVMLALQEVLGGMTEDPPDVDTALAAVDQWPAGSSDEARLAVLLRALLEREVASGTNGDDAARDPRELARRVMLQHRMQALAASALDTLGRLGVSNPQHEASLRNFFDQAELALLLGDEDVLPDASMWTAPGFDPVAAVVFAAMAQACQRADAELDAFLAQWAPWQARQAILAAQGARSPQAADPDSE
jgi:hypothetical protein